MVETIIGVATGLVGLCLGAVLGALLALRYTKQEILVARQNAERERQRADNALDQLARQIRGEPISVAGVEARESAFERTLNQDEELREMFLEETEGGTEETPNAQ